MRSTKLHESLKFISVFDESTKYVQIQSARRIIIIGPNILSTLDFLLQFPLKKFLLKHLSIFQ